MTTSCLFAACCLVVAPPAWDVTQEQARFQGTWVVLSAERKGMAIREEECANMLLTFTGDKVLMKVGSKPVEKRYTIDISQKPATIDFVNPSNKAKSLGIYRFQGDRLTICFEGAKPVRPTAFETKTGDYRIQLVLRREEP